MKQKVLFLDRDGTIIADPPPSYQVDTFEKLEFLPKVLSSLRKIVQETDYLLVMVTNQDGLGTDAFPEDTFWPYHEFMMKTLEGEGIHFHEVLIDKSYPEDNLDTRKPGIGLVRHYLNGDYDIENSVMVGDRKSDVELAKNLGCKSIYISDEAFDEADLTTSDWEKMYEWLKLPERKVTVQRKTKETAIDITLNLDGTGVSEVSTGIGFFDHMLDQVAKHSGSDLTIKVDGDLEIDEHHTIEDTALALGQAFADALGDKKGINRYGFLLPMDDALAQVALDFGGRPWLEWEAQFQREKVGEMPTEMFFHFFKSFSDTAHCNLNIKAEGNNEHHKIEAIFKAFAKSIKMAIKRDVVAMEMIPSTKGTI